MGADLLFVQRKKQLYYVCLVFVGVLIAAFFVSDLFYYMNAVQLIIYLLWFVVSVTWSLYFFPGSFKHAIGAIIIYSLGIGLIGFFDGDEMLIVSVSIPIVAVLILITLLVQRYFLRKRKM